MDNALNEKLSLENNPHVQNKDQDNQKILCTHCKRTKSNGLSCLGICVSDSEY